MDGPSLSWLRTSTNSSRDASERPARSVRLSRIGVGSVTSRGLLGLWLFGNTFGFGKRSTLSTSRTPLMSFLGDGRLMASTLETMNHLLVECPFSRVLWYEVLSWIRSTCTPPTAGDSFAAWWQESFHSSPSSARKGTASLVMLTAWSIWKHRNAAIFYNATPNLASLLDLIKTDARCWVRVGAVGLGAVLPADPS